MKNEIVITRAPRRHLVPVDDVPKGKYYLDWLGNIIYKADIDHYMTMTTQSGVLWETGMAYVFPDFEAVCKWVTGGMCVNTLPMNCFHEFVKADSLPVGSWGTLLDTGCISAGGDQKPIGDYPNPRVVTIVELADGKYISESACFPRPAMMGGFIWPLGPGDTITIKAL